MKSIEQFKQYVKPTDKIISQRMTQTVLEKQGFMSLINSLFDDTYSLKEKTFCMINDITERPKCKTCGKEISFNNNAVKYAIYCGQKCANADPEVLAKNKAGVSKALKKAYEERGDDIKEKRSNTLKENYGSDATSPFSIKEIQDKAKDSIKEKYGVDNSFQMESCRDNRRKYQQSESIKKYKELGIDIEYVSSGWVKVKNYCDLHQEFVININYLRSRYHRDRNICPICNIFHTHTGLERKVSKYLDSININYEHATRKIITPLELDIFIPSHNIAIELNGMYWHNEHNKPINYHNDKWKKCKDKGIQLLQFWEDDINNKFNIISSIINNKLNINYINDYKISNINNIEENVYNKFILENDIQHIKFSNIKIGLYSNNILTAVLGLNIIKNSTGQEYSNCYEITNYTNLLNTDKSSIFSHLLKYIEITYKPKLLVYNDNLDCTNETMFINNNFIVDNNININYTWCDGDNRYNKNIFNNLELEEDEISKSEEIVMNDRGYYRCYDAGNLKYIKKYTL